MLRTKSLRIATGLEESTDKVPPLPIWEPPRTAPPRTSLGFGGSTSSLPATAVPTVESAKRSRKTSMPQWASPPVPPQSQQAGGATLTTPKEVRRKRSTTDLRGASLPSKHIRIVKPDSEWRQDVPHRGTQEGAIRPRQHRRTASGASSTSSFELVPLKPPPIPDKTERRKRSSIISSFSSSKSLTPLQILRSTGFLSAGMIRDEAPPMEVILSSSSSTSGRSGSRTEYSEPSPTTCSADPGSAEESKGFKMAKRNSLLHQEAAPFDMTATDSMWFQPLEKKATNNNEPSRTRQAPTRKPPPLPINSNLALPESRPVLVLPGSPGGGPRSGLSEAETDDADSDNIGSALDELSGQWPLPPRRSLIIVGHRGELWTSPNSESWTPDKASFPPRDSICFSSKGFSSSSVKARIRNLNFSEEQLTVLREHLRSAPRVSTRKPPFPVSVNNRTKDSPPVSPTVSAAYGSPSSETAVKMSEARIEADDVVDGMVQAVLHLSSVYSPGQFNRITIVSSSWRNFTAFCQRNDRAIVSAAIGDASRSLSVTVQDDDGAGKVYCSMTLEGARFPEPSSPNGLKRVVTKFNVHLPVSLAAVGRRCKESSVGEGIDEIQGERIAVRPPVGMMARSRSKRNALVLPGLPGSR
ncbi:hypothetical protein FS837_009541 [Tulasnella sp. UAMH 9824]|nr:hypothetical protein FS837_009541 [Tulasnella sp. UAMH 9824]